MKSVEPLTSFSRLKETLQEKGISIADHVNGYEASLHIISDIDAQSDFLEISEEGIFYTTPDGVKQRGFLYLMETIGSVHPKAHICQCSNLKNFNSTLRADRYIWSSRRNIYIKMFGGVFGVSSLDICKHCLSSLNGYRIPGFPSNTHQFVGRLEDGTADSLFPTRNRLDIFGRTSDWYIIRHDYLERVNYTCEECGRVYDTIDLRPYIDVVHINGHSDQNDYSNLRCLCTECRKNLSPDKKNLAISNLIIQLMNPLNSIIYRK